MDGKRLEEEKDVRKESEKILRQSLKCMIENCPDELKIQLDAERLSEEINELITVQRQGDNPVMGLFDLNLNQYVTINMLALVSLLAEELGRILDKNPQYSSWTVAASACVFLTTFLNMIQPRMSMELDMLDANVYCALLKRQRERPVNEMITYEEVVKCIREFDREADISRCLTHLQEKKLIRRLGNGFLVIREIKVKAV